MGMKQFSLDLSKSEQLADCLRKAGFEVEVLIDEGIGATIRCRSLGMETDLMIHPGNKDEPGRFLVNVFVHYRLFALKRSREFFARIESALLANGGCPDADG